MDQEQPMTAALATHKSPGFVEEIELQGHIIDSLLLPKVLDEILTRRGTYVLKDIRIGQRQTDPSYARIELRGRTRRDLQEILAAIPERGATPVDQTDGRHLAADMDGAFPEDFY